MRNALLIALAIVMFAFVVNFSVAPMLSAEPVAAPLFQVPTPGRGTPASGPGITAYVAVTTTDAQVMCAAPSGQLHNYIYQASCVNTSGTAAVAIIKDGSTGIWPVPCGVSGSPAPIIAFNPPLEIPTVAHAASMAMSAGVTTAYMAMQCQTSR